MKKLTKLFALFVMTSASVAAWGAAPTGYYKAAEGKNQAALLSALEDIVGNHTVVSYDGLWSLFQTSDVTSDGYVWDMYSTAKFRHGSNKCGNYSVIGDCYNREHSFPKSWFGDAKPMYSDAYHLYPTDGKVNGQRSNYPFGECDNGTVLPSSSKGASLGKLGTSTFKGYSGTVFEPDDQYKGDFARSYFYMAAAYNSRIATWNSPQLAGNRYPAFSAWSVELLMKWSREDPVSPKEINRNEAVYAAQKNRNPFIDYPELAEYIWGTKKNEGWTPGGTVDPVMVSPTDGSTIDFGVCGVGRTFTKEMKVKAAGLTEELNIAIKGGAAFTVTPNVIDQALANAGTTVTISYKPTAAGKASAQLQIYSGEVGANVNLTGEATDGIPALAATNVTFDGFDANWTNVDGGGNYNLTVYESDGKTVVSGYPVSVASALESYRVNDLNYSSDYSYTLSSGARTSNIIKVRTLDPDKVLTFGNYSSNMVKLSAAPGEVSEPAELEVFTEYITDNVTVTATEGFEVSLDKTNWASTITNMDPSGESFYVRMKANDKEGEYKGVLSLSAGTFEGEELDLIGTVAVPRSFMEDFETISLSSYNGGTNVQGTACKWNLTNCGAYGQTGQDHFNGEKALRFGKDATSSAEMAEDKLKGVGVLSFWMAPYGTDGAISVKVSYTTDNGASWTDLDNIAMEKGAEFKQFTYTLNVDKPVRVRFVQTEGKRWNLDDVAMTDYDSSGVTDGVADRTWDAWSTGDGIMIDAAKGGKFEIYGTDAALKYSEEVTGTVNVALEKGMYIVVCGNDAKKVVVK